jgi:hypothetical protein
MWARFALIAGVSWTLGCVSYLTVEKAGKETEGIRYSLPQPFLLVKPVQTGGIEIEVVYLPDPSNEYAIESRSFLSATKFDVTLEKGLLKQVVFNPDASAVARQLVESAGNVGKAELEAHAEAEKKRAEVKAVARQKALDARGEVLKAQEKLDRLNELKKQGVAGLDDEIKKAQIALVEAQAAAAKAEDAARMSGFNVAKEEASAKSELPQAWGPVLFRIIDSETGVELRAVDSQRFFDTYKPETKTDPRIPSLQISGSATLQPVGGKIEFVVESDLPLDDVMDVDLLDSNNNDTNRVLTYSLQTDSKKKIVVNLDRSTPQGRYNLSVAFKYKGKPARKDIAVYVSS